MDNAEKKRLANEKRLKAVQEWKKNRKQQNVFKVQPKIIVVPKDNIKSKIKLFDSDGEEENEEQVHNFNIRPQFEGERGKQLLERSSELSSRFKLDERFKDDEKPTEVAGENEEKSKNIKILESILGYEVIEKYSDGKDSKKKKRLMRFDPEDENTSKFLKTYEVTEADSQKKKKGTKEAIERSEPKEIPITTERYIEVSSNLKNILQSSSSPFTLTAKFSTNDDQTSSIPCNDFLSPKEPGEDLQRLKPKSSITQNLQSNENKFETQGRLNFFICKDDIRLKEGIEFFQRPKSLDEIREEWNSKKEDFVKLFMKKKKTSRRSFVKKPNASQRNRIFRKK